MRIISGKYRRRLLVSPPDAFTTRPIPDRVKESVFGILRGNIPDARVIDAFAGTGSIGLEALSRGAQHCVFIERDKRIAAVLERNIDTLECHEQATLVQGDALGSAVLTQIGAMGGVDLIFFDPPYPVVRDAGSVELGEEGGWQRCKRQFERLISRLSDTGFAVLRTPWPFRHAMQTDVTAALSGDAATPPTRRRRGKGRDEDDDGRVEREWIGSEIDIEAIERETRELERRAEQRSASRGSGDADPEKPRIKRHLTAKDLADDANLEDEAVSNAADVEEGDDHVEAAGVVYQPVDLAMSGADGPETHVYGSTAVHLYMKARGG